MSLPSQHRASRADTRKNSAIDDVPKSEESAERTTTDRDASRVSQTAACRRQPRCLPHAASRANAEHVRVVAVFPLKPVDLQAAQSGSPVRVAVVGRTICLSGVSVAGERRSKVSCKFLKECRLPESWVGRSNVGVRRPCELLAGRQGFEPRYRGPECESPISVRFDSLRFLRFSRRPLAPRRSVSLRSCAACLTVSHALATAIRVAAAATPL